MQATSRSKELVGGLLSPTDSAKVKKDHESLVQHIWSLPQIERVARQQNIQGTKLPVLMELLSLVDDKLEYQSDQLHKRSRQQEEEKSQHMMPPKVPVLQMQPNSYSNKPRQTVDASRNSASLRVSTS